jgi:phosphoribosylformylglycinamidine cyclo-ligase
MSSRTPISYRDAGVDIDAGNALVRTIKPFAAATARRGVIGGLGGFGALFDLAGAGYRNPILVSTTDGVGTKLKLAVTLGRHATIGIDLVAMSVNDLIVQGAEPLFFLDYFATGRLDVAVASTVVEGIARGCRESGCALVGGETAEMPDMYADGDYDLAGFCVGAVEADHLIDGRDVRPGDAVLGLASSGVHSNGYSLVRRILTVTGADLNAPFEAGTLADALLAPTRIYVRPVLALARALPVKAIAHITGGGMLEKFPRVLPAGVTARVDARRWRHPPIFDWLRNQGSVEVNEMLRTFNLGIGMVIVVDAGDADRACALLAGFGETATVIGVIEAGAGAPTVRIDGYA